MLDEAVNVIEVIALKVSADLTPCPVRPDVAEGEALFTAEAVNADQPELVFFKLHHANVVAF